VSLYQTIKRAAPATQRAFAFEAGSVPISAKKPCTTPACTALVQNGKCAAHQTQARQADDRRRGNSYQRGYTRKWQEASKGYLRVHPMCECAECKAAPAPLRAVVVDHIEPHKGDMAKFWDRNNWQAMAKVCHDKKTAREDGGFGRASVTRIA